jgi:5S rRNA maturation endonuclease (ribonuclease M5)
MKFKIEAVVAEAFDNNGQRIEPKKNKYFTKVYEVFVKDRSDALIAAGNRISAESLTHQGLWIV